MKRHFYISDSLDDLATLENELSSIGFEKPQFHVLSNNEAGLENHHLHAVESVLKSDVVYKTEIGFFIGLFISIAVLLFAGLWRHTNLYMGPFYFSRNNFIGFLHLGRWLHWHPGNTS